jgi:hypothetical protein
MVSGRTRTSTGFPLATSAEAELFPEIDLAAPITVRRFTYTWPVRILDRMVAPLVRLRAVGSLEPDDLALSAFRAAGGPVPPREEWDRWLGPEFTLRMELLARGDYSSLGKLHWRAILVSAALGRIRLERYLAAGRSLGQVTDPIFVVGLPRTGTSLLQRLIAEDPERRGLRTFELQGPIPPLSPSIFAPLKRRAYAALISAIYRTFMPELIRIHHTSITSLEECWMLFMSSYAVLNADYILVPQAEFGDHLLEDGLLSAYGRYEKLLRILALEAPDEKFVLKSPEHLWFLPSLLRTFPNARVIWTHRDPASAVPSYAAQASLPSRQHHGYVDPKAMGQRVMQRFLQGVERGARACDEFPAARITHVRYQELMADPVAATRRAYEDLGLTVGREHEGRMRSFLARPQKDKHQNRYRADVFGLDASEIRAAFAPYMQRFAVEADLPRSAGLEAPAALMTERLPES